MAKRIAALTLLLACLACVQAQELSRLPQEVKGIWKGYYEPIPSPKAMFNDTLCLIWAFQTPRFAAVLGRAIDKDDTESCLDSTKIDLAGGSSTQQTAFIVWYQNMSCTANNEIVMKSSQARERIREDGLVEAICSIFKREDDEEGPKLLMTVGHQVNREGTDYPDAVCPRSIDDRNPTRVLGTLVLRAVNQDTVVNEEDFTCR